ncbi:fimbrial protein [Stenotrophomonas maltophilia]|uniref:fimbrial protein n=1 Tax=Stenotrophomonas maltophilia TaxID=40324 RepID=UPI001559E112|nr:fimbrial protein [Stenotrophomonas maltophilia]
MLKNRRFRQHSLAMLAAPLMLVISGAASAACSDYSGDYSFSIGSSVKLVANAADVGEALSPWLSSNEVTTTLCGYGGTYTQSNVFNASAPEVGIFVEGGKTYSVFATGIVGIGIALSVRPSILYDTTSWPIRAGVPLDKVVASPPWGGGLEVIQDMRVRFIKTGDAPEQTETLANLKLLDMEHHQNGYRWSQRQYLGNMTVEVLHRPLCHVTPKTVPLGLVALTGLPSQWSFGPTRFFTVDLNCETGAGRVNYYIEPTGATSAVDVDRGVVDVQGAAKGVGVQLLQADGSQIKLGRSYPFGSSAADGARSETFGARFIRTAASAGDTEPGDASATVRFRIDYP